MESNQALYPIREVSRITGVNSITLRAWERRYGLIEPVRTDSGHRLYTDEHIQQIHQAVTLTQQGIPISRVKSLIEQMPSPLADFSEVSQSDSGTRKTADSLDEFLLQPLFNLNVLGFEQALDQLFSDFPEQQAYAELVKLSLQQQALSVAQRTLWQNIVALRLQIRLRYQLQAMSKHHLSKTLLVDDSQTKCPVLSLLLRIYYAQQGIHAWVLELSAQDAMENLLPLMKSFEAKSVVLIGLQEMADEAIWAQWSARYRSVEMQVWWQAEEPKNLVSLVQNQSLLVNELFTGR